MDTGSEKATVILIVPVLESLHFLSEMIMVQDTWDLKA